MKTEQQLARTELELRAIDVAYAELHYLDYRPKHDSWSKYLRALGSKLSEALQHGEFHAKNPGYRIG
jgi:hypothetical protein